MKNSITPFVLIAVIMSANAYAGQPTTCTGFLAGPHDKIVVPENGFCFLFGAQVKGNVDAQANSRLFTAFSTIGGNIRADQAEVAQLLNGTLIHGNVSIRRGETDDPIFDVALCGTTIRGNVDIEEMTGEVLMGGGPPFCPNTIRGQLTIRDNLITNGLEIVSNTIGKHFFVLNNLGPGPKTVSGNEIERHLRCFGNAQPFVGGPNVAEKTDGQCF